MRKRMRACGTVFLLLCSIFLAPLPGAAAATSEVEIGLSPGGENLFAAMEGMLPGESVTDYFTVTNKGWHACAFHLQAQAAGAADFEDGAAGKAASDELLSLLDMRVVLHKAQSAAEITGPGTVLYSGKAIAQHGSSFLGQDVELGVLPAGASVVIETTISVPKELDNHYDLMRAKFWWRFYAASVENSVPPSQPPPAPPSSSAPITVLPDGFWKIPDVGSVYPGDTVNYTISGFFNNEDEPVYGFTISDIFPEGLLFESASLPAFSNSGSAAYNITYTTNRRGMQTLHSAVPASQPFFFTAPALQGGEYITTLSFEFGDVPAGFATGNTLAITCRVAPSPPTRTLINRAMMFYDTKNGPVREESGNKEVELGSGSRPLETIGDDAGPAVGLQRKVSWALVNLCLTVLCLLVSAGLLGQFLLRLLKRKPQKGEAARLAAGHETPEEMDALFPAAETAGAPPPETEHPPEKRRIAPFVLQWLAILAGVFTLGLFLYTQNMQLPMQLVDHWTVFVVMAAVLQLLLFMGWIAGRGRPRPPDEDETPPWEDEGIFAPPVAAEGPAPPPLFEAPEQAPQEE